MLSYTLSSSDRIWDIVCPTNEEMGTPLEEMGTPLKLWEEMGTPLGDGDALEIMRCSVKGISNA